MVKDMEYNKSYLKRFLSGRMFHHPFNKDNKNRNKNIIILILDLISRVAGVVSSGNPKLEFAKQTNLLSLKGIFYGRK